MRTVPESRITHEMKAVIDALQHAADPLAELARIERRRSDELVRNAVQSDEKDWDKLTHGLGRNDMPWLLYLVWERLPHDEKVKGIADVWTSAEYPERQFNRHEGAERSRRMRHGMYPVSSHPHSLVMPNRWLRSRWLML